jgi:homoserine O-succinyltransferase
LRPECLDIGLINNMPDSTLEATERQFTELIGAAAGDRTVRLRFFSLPEIPRGDDAASRMRALYGDLDELARDRLDGLIITGCEPKAASLTEEPYWQSLTRVIDWAEHNTSSTIFSCLAAHAAVLHLDAIKRSPLGKKCSGVFDCVKLSDDPLLEGVASPLRTPHSRMNNLREEELVAHGYRILTSSPKAGVDIFVKEWRSLFVFFQGHPEYNADSLLREYRRDIGRFLRGEASTYPAMPEGYFDRPTAEALATFAGRAEVERHEGLLRELSAHLADQPANGWHASAITIFGNWLGTLASRKQKRG